MPHRRRNEDDEDTPVPAEPTSWRIRVPRAPIMKLAALVISSMLIAVATTFLSTMTKVDANGARIATMAVEHAHLAVEVAVLRARLDDHLNPRGPQP